MSFSQQVMQGGMGSADKIPSGFRKAQLQQFTPEQMQLYQQMFGHLGQDSFTSKLASGDQGSFDQMEAPALKQFSALQGNIASRFSDMGSGARRSSGFQNYMGQQAQDFAGQLQSQRQSLQRQALQDLMGFSNQLLNQRPWETALAEKRQKAPGFWEQTGGAFANSFAENAGQKLSGNFFS